MLPGQGVSAQVEGRRILAGNPELLREHGIGMASAASVGGYLKNGSL